MERRRTKIVCTIGPATESPEMMEKLMLAGMDVARLNFSHGTQSQHAKNIANLQQTAERLGRPLAILQDLMGPKIRTGRLKGGEPILLRDGQGFTITTRPLEGTEQIVSTTYPALARDVRPGNRILLDDGLMELEVLSQDEKEVRCRVIDGGLLRDNKGINLPGVPISSPAFTEKDRRDLESGIKHQADYIALSFVRDPEDVVPVREVLKRHGLDTPIIAKIEKPEAVEKLDSIIEAFDGVMVARGDLGVEMPPERVPALQKAIIAKANRAEKLVITATQMLESMVENPRPTRAEASDVANAILDGTDAVMLSGETAIGRYPVQAVEMMARIVCEAEGLLHYEEHDHPAQDYSQAISHAARQIAHDAERVRAIAPFTKSGYTARLVSKDRPRVPVLAFTAEPRVYRRLALVWGVTPFLCPTVHSVEEMIDLVERSLLAGGYVGEGDSVVIVGGLPIGSGSPTNFLKLQTVILGDGA